MSDPFLEFVDRLVTALVEREDERVGDLLADPRATLLPTSVLDEVVGILSLPPAARRSPVQALELFRRTEEQLVAEAHRAAWRARRRLTPARTDEAETGEGASARGDSEAAQLEFDFARRRQYAS